MSKNVNQIAPTYAIEREQHYEKIKYFLEHEPLIEYQIHLHASDKKDVQPRKIDLPIEYNTAKNIYTAIQDAKKELSPIEYQIIEGVRHKKTFKYIAETEGIGTTTAYAIYNKVLDFFMFYFFRSAATAEAFAKIRVGIATPKN